MVKSVQYNGSTTNTADSLFGNTSLFSTTPTKLSSTAQSLFNLEPTKPVELSPAAQSALKEMDAIQAQAEKAGERVAQIQAEQMKQQEALSRQLEAQREELARQAEERRKVEEKAAKGLKEKLKSDPTMLVKADIDALLSSEAYQKAGDLRRQAMMAQKSAEIRQRLIAQGVSPEEAEASANTFESSIQSDINQFKQDAEDGWFSPVKDFFRRTAQQFNDWQAAGNIKDAGLITEAQGDLLSRGKARGWAVDEALERDPEIRNFLIRDGAIDSLSEFRLKPGLTAAQKSELKTRLENAYQGVYSDFAKNNKEATDWRAGMSAEQRREMDNFSFEAEQMSAKYDPNDDSLLTSLSKTWDSVTLAARYPTTLLTDNSGSLAVAAGSTVVNIGLTAASAVPGLNAATAPAAAAGWARTAQTVRKLSNVLINSVGNAELVEADVINSAREQIAASSVADLAKANPEQWAAMLKLTDGNEELAKQKLVTMTAADKWGSAWLLGFASGVVGPETLISSAISRGAAKRIARDSIEGIAAQSTAQITSRNVAKNAALWSVGTLSEGAEEGFTTYFTNLATRNANGTQDLWDGFEESFGTGLAMGGMMSSVATALNTVQTVRSETELRDRAVAVAPLSDANIMAKTEQYMALGEVDFNTLRKTMMDDLTSFASNVNHAFARSPEAISAQRQMYFDTFIDNANVLDRLPSSQQRELKNLAKEAFDGNININGYDRAQNTAAMQVLADSTQRPADPVLADAWRVIHGKELKQVAEPKLAEATAKLYKQLFPNGEVNETTRQRVNRTTQILRDIVNDDPSITASDKRTLLQRANVYFDASTRRAGDPNANEETKQSTQGTDSSNNGGGVQQGEPSRQGQQAEATDAGQATADSQGTRDGATRQAGEQSSGTTTTDGVSADAQSDVAGTREVPQVEPTTYTSGEIDVPSATPAIPGSVGQTNQTSGPVGRAVATPTPTAESGGVTGTPPTERRTDGSSTATTTTSDTLGGNDGYSAETRSIGTSNSPISTEVRDGKGNVIGYRRAGEGAFTSYRTGQFHQVALRERGIFVRIPMSRLMGNATNRERYIQTFSNATLQATFNKMLSMGDRVKSSSWFPLVYSEMERRSLPVRPVETTERDLPLVERTLVADSLGMILNRAGKDGVIIKYDGELTFVPYDGSAALVLDNPNATLASIGFAEAQANVERPKKYLRRLQRPRTVNIDTLLGKIHAALDVEQSTFTFERQPTAVKQGVAKTDEQLDSQLRRSLDIIDNLLGGVSEDELLDFVEFTIASKLYNGGKFNELSREAQVLAVASLATELLNDPETPAIARAVRANRAEVQAEEVSRRIAQAGVATDMMWLDLYSRFNRNVTAKVHGKNDPITGSADLVRELRSIKAASARAMGGIVTETMSNLSPESIVTLNTLVGAINSHNEADLPSTEVTTRQEVVISLLRAPDSTRKKTLTAYAKLVPEGERKVFRKALTSFISDLVDTNAVAREVALGEATRPAYKRKAVDYEIKPRPLRVSSSAVDTREDDALPPRVRRAPSKQFAPTKIEFPQPKQPKQPKQPRLASKTRRDITPTVIRGDVGERAKLARDLETMSFSDNDLPQQVLMAIQTEPAPYRDTPATKRESSAEVIKNLINLATWQGSNITINTDSNLSVAGVVDITENGAEITLKNGHDLDTMTHELAHAITAQSVMSGNFQQEVDFLNNLADRLHRSLNDLRLQNVDKSALRRDLNYVQAFNDEYAKAAEMTALLFENREIWQAISHLDGTPAKRRKGLLRWIDNALDALRTLLGVGSTQLSNDTFDVVTRLIMGGKTNKAKGVTKLFSKKLTSKTKRETTNETQDTTGEQPTNARVATTEESADTLRDGRETDDEAGAVRGQSEEANRTAQEEPSNQVETAEVSNETAGTDTQGDDTNVSGSNQQAEPTASAVGEDTGNIRQLTATDIESATTADEVIATGTVPVANNGPVALGDTPTEQVAIIQPLIVRGTTIDTAYTNEGQHTPAEESAQAVFDTHPITDTAEDGTTVAEIAVALADNFGVNSTEPMTPPKKLSSKKKGEPRKAVVEKFKRPESERSDRLFTNETSLANAVHNQLFKTVQEGESNQAQWLEYLVANDFEGHLAEVINSVEYLQAGIDAAMSNSSVATARAPITDYLRWDKRSSDPKYKGKKYFSVEGAAQKVASHLAGITPRFDDYLNGMENVPRSGMAQDSAKPSVSLAKISSMKNAIYGFIHTTYIDPVIKLIEDKTFKYPKNKDIGTDMGRYAKYRHALEEYGDSWLKGKNDKVAELRNKIAENETAILDIVNDIVGNLTIEDILANENSRRSTANRLSEVPRRKFNANVEEHARLTRELTKAEKDATNSADVWFGRVSREDFPDMKLPDGHTKAELEALIAELEATYDKADLEEVADKIYGAYAGIRTTGATYGVYDSVQLKSFNDIKHKKYVHMARGHRDKPSEFEEDVINESLFDGVDDANLVEQYKTLGLTRDLSKYKRAGSTSEVDDALTNLGRLARNVAGRAASVEFEQDIQGLFEGTLNQLVLEGKPTAEQITEFKTGIVQKGAVAGLVRIRSDLPSRFVPSEFKHITPVLGKGWEINEKTGEYELVPYKYYFTDPVIQNELTHNVDVNSKWNTNIVTANIRTFTRWWSSFATSRYLLWNMWNFAREFMERGATIMFRPVVDDAGKRVSGTKLAALFAKNLSRMSVDLDLQAQIYRYLAFREMRTPAQRELHNLYTSGTIQVMTDLTDKYDFMGEQDRSALDNFANYTQKLMKRLGSKSGLTNMVNVTADQAIKWYHIRVAEVPQVVNAMAMHRAYRDAGVNMTEANHRVRDSFDPTRTKSTLVQSLSNYLPFIRSTGAGNYNTMRTLGDAFLRGSRADRAKAVLKLTLLGLSAYATVQLASAAFGDDEDGEDLVAQFDQGELNRGVPLRMSDGKVIFLPVGHGLPSMIWSFATSLHRLVNGRTDGWGVAGNLVEQFAKNSFPANAPTGDQLANSGGKAVFLNLMPTMFLPAAEIILNQTQFGSNEIVRNSTPRGERDSDQDNFNTPEVYKDMAKDIYKMTGGVVDWRPENIHHVMRSYAGVGPFRSIDAALQDKGKKTAGVFANKGERMGVFATLVGADIGISTSVMSNESRYYSLAEHKPKILQKYNVPETMTDGDTYDKVDLTGIDTSGINFDRETSAERFAHQLRAAGATDAEVQLVVNLTLADTKRKALQKEVSKVGRSVYNSTRRGTATEYTEADVFEAATALDQLYYDTVINNNQFTQRVK